MLKLFSGLPGKVAVKIQAPPAHGRRGLLIESNATDRMFVGSAIKTFALCEAFRQADSPDVIAKITERQLVLDESVWNADSQSFNPPNLSGTVTERTALEAMICHSDNTATDITFKLVGVDRIRKLIARAGCSCANLVGASPAPVRLRSWSLAARITWCHACLTATSLWTGAAPRTRGVARC